MAMDLELDDDVFYADIRKQIDLLITDEDENNPISLSSSVSFQNYNLIRERKGTGVFIPRCSQPRKKQNNHPHQTKQGSFGSLVSKQQLPHYVYDNNNSTTLNNNQERITLHHAASN
ncbi:hypothetical protein BRARA_A03675 [Brassica rapa]|uniref:Uncharacterized protein n=1 Tax=Brassica campestris TaxID=3711 RepID=A0A398AW96_BRACM|nr:uncharacterized protein LOC106381960 isoform X2 [Brassica napus]RID81068.1 hypothetical protein BRARA_A03675 [Brassica rapa]